MSDAIWRMSEAEYKRLQYGWENIGHEMEADSFLGRVVMGSVCVEFLIREDGTDALGYSNDYNTARKDEKYYLDEFNDGSKYYEIDDDRFERFKAKMLDIAFGYGNPFDVFKKNVEGCLRDEFPEATSVQSTAHLWNENEIKMSNTTTYEMTADVKCYICANTPEEARAKFLGILQTSGVYNVSARHVPRQKGMTANGHECCYMKLRDAAEKIIEDFENGNASSFSFAEANEESQKNDVENFDGSGWCVAFKIDPMKYFDGYGVHIGVSSYGNGYMSVVSGDDDTVSKLIDMMSDEMNTHGCACDADGMIYLEKEE